MRSWLVALLGMTACYAPTVPQGAPCQRTDECPGDQLCVAGACARPGSLPADASDDAPADAAMGSGDRDNDGKLDAVDNCPDVANADQGNEDGDRFGDVCDPCPPVAGDALPDPDGDGVAGICDPNPNTPGERIELFEGFHHGLPVWTRSPGWAVAGDAVRLTAAAGVREYLLPVPPRSLRDPSHVALFASVVVEQAVGGLTIDHAFGLATTYQASADSGIECALYQPIGSNGPRNVNLYDDFQSASLGSAAHVWQDGTAYTMSVTRNGASYSCKMSGSTGSATITRSSGSAPAQTALVVRAFAMTARVNWVLVVGSP